MKPRSPLQIVRAVWFALLVREIQAMAGRRRLGVFWAIAEPALHILILSLVMGTLRGRLDIAGHPYPVFLLVGLGPFLAYRRIVMIVASGVGSARSLLAYKQITPLDVFCVRAFTVFGLAAVVYMLIVAGFIWWGWDMSIQQPLQWIGCIIMGLLLSFSLGLVLAALVNAMPDIDVVVRMAFLPLYFISGVIVPAAHMPPHLLPYLMWNPYLHINELTRVAALENFQTVPGISATYAVAVIGVLLFCGLGMYRVMRVKLVAIKGSI